MHKKNQTIYSEIGKDGDLVSRSVDRSLKRKHNTYIPSEYMSLGMYFLVPILLGLGAGIWLDKRFDTGSLFTILLMLLGICSAFYNLYSLTKKR